MCILCMLVVALLIEKKKIQVEPSIVLISVIALSFFALKRVCRTSIDSRRYRTTIATLRERNATRCRAPWNVRQGKDKLWNRIQNNGLSLVAPGKIDNDGTH